MSDAYPKLRNLEALPHVEGDRPVILLRDPRQISEDTLVVSPQVYHLLTLFNGANSVLDIQTVLTRQSGQIVFREQVESLVDHLDKAYFLDNENFRLAIKDYRNPSFKTFDRKIKNDVTFLINNLEKKYRYSEKGAQEVCIYVVDNDLARKFGQAV